MDVGKTNEDDRDAWVRKALGDLPAGWTLLDVGAGEQRYRGACFHLRYVAQDFGRYEGTGDGKGLQPGRWDTSSVDVVSDAASIPRPDGSFDAVLLTEVLEHVPDPLAVLREVARLTRPGGRLVLTAPFCSITHFSPYFFHTGFSRSFYEHHLPVFGFRILELSPNGNYFEFLAQELRRVEHVAETYGAGPEGLLAKRARRFYLRALARMSERDRGSWDLLCHGFHVRAERA